MNLKVIKSCEKNIMSLFASYSRLYAVRFRQGGVETED